MMDSNHNSIARAITKSIGIDCSPQQVFEFLADGVNWPLWAIVNIRSIGKADDPEWWDMVTIHGPARLRIRPEAQYGILDHDYHDGQAHWTVPARVVPNGPGTEFMMTFFQPEAFTDEFFDNQIKLVDVELSELKRLLETSASHI